MIFFIWSHDIVSINELTPILKIIGQFEVKYPKTLSINTITSVLNVSTYIITTITAWPFGLAAILAIMSISTFTTAVILYVCYQWFVHGCFLYSQFCLCWRQTADKNKATEHQHSEIPLILLLKTFKSVLCDHTVYFHIVHHDNHEDTHMCSHHLTVNTWRCYDMVLMSMAWLDWWQKSCNICNLYMWKHSLRHYNFLYDIKLPHLSTRYLYFSK